MIKIDVTTERHGEISGDSNIVILEMKYILKEFIMLTMVRHYPLQWV